ncbi:MAG: chromate resistance protein ChrB domain-containing protein [Opitutaceae bacterium]
MNFKGWLLLLYALPARSGTQRVSLWRKLKKSGALPLKTSAYLLPEAPAHNERFQWLAQQIKDAGGDATLIRAKEIEGLSHRQLVAQFNDARAADYGELAQEMTKLLRANRRKLTDSFESALERARGWLTEIQQIDFFECPRAQDALMLLKQAEGLRRKKKSEPAPALHRRDYAGKTWLTRPHPQIDRVGSAWLIKRYIDARARFVFAAKTADHPAAVPYDMADVALTHHGDDCTFETLLRRFSIRDPALQNMAEMVHDADLDDGKFGAPGAEGIDRVLKGLARLGWTDDTILQHGFVCFDALLAQLKGS